MATNVTNHIACPDARMYAHMVRVHTILFTAIADCITGVAILCHRLLAATPSTPSRPKVVVSHSEQWHC